MDAHPCPDPMGTMPEHEKSERALGLSPAQVVGSALAATSAALVASMAGTAGTIIGAGVGSLIATVGAAVYTWWIRRTGEIARRTAAQMRLAALATQPLPRTVAQGPMRFRKDRGSATDQGAAEAGTPPEGQHVDTADPDRPEDQDETRFTLPWRKILLATAVVGVITLATITVIEGIAGRPVSSLTGGSDSTGTSVGHVVRSDDNAEKAPTEEDQAPPATEEPTPGQDVTTDAPEPTPSVDPEPTEEPSEEPSAPVPSETVEEPAVP